MKKPVLVSGTDGVGTKLKLAFLMDKHDTVGIDCVAMCVNDIICGGAAPSSSWTTSPAARTTPGASRTSSPASPRGCRQAECALVGGETAEMPGFYPKEEYDLAGFSVGLVDEEKIIDGRRLSEADVLIGLASSGVHSNGFSLVRKVFDVEHADLKTPREDLGGKSLGEALLAPTRIYVRSVKALLRAGVDIHAVSHITGGGFYENVPRMMTQGAHRPDRPEHLPPPAHLRSDPEDRGIPERDMYNTYNMGIGMILALPAEQAEQALSVLKGAGETAYQIGRVIPGEAGVGWSDHIRNEK